MITHNGHIGIIEGLNDPSGINRVIITGYYDGPTEGLLENIMDGTDYSFEIASDVTSEIRQFRLRPLRYNSFQEFEDAFADVEAPNWPDWTPKWSFSTPEIEQNVTQRIDDIFESAGEVEWIISAPRGTDFRSFHATRIKTAQLV